MSPPTVVKWIESGALPAHVTPGGHRRVSIADLEDFAERRKTGQGNSGAEEPPCSVLIVGREPDFADMVAEFLELNGHCKVLYADSALVAGYHAGAAKPRALLVDTDTPDVDLRLLVGLCDPTAVVLLTSPLSADLGPLLATVPDAEVVPKPVKLDHLMGLLIKT